MSIQDQIRQHEFNASLYEKDCAKWLRRGDLGVARYCAEHAATERHLARELEDTNTIAGAARIEYLDQRIAAHKQEANRG
jgi:hypothetical protein